MQNKLVTAAVGRAQREVLIWGGLFISMDTWSRAFADKFLKYQPLRSRLDSLGYKCKLVTVVFDSLGNVHMVSGLQIAESKATGRNTARFQLLLAALLCGEGAFCILKMLLYPRPLK
jgi:hypothetical protein